MDKATITAIENVLDHRSQNGASDESLIGWLNELKKLPFHASPHSQQTLEMFLDAIKQTPLKS